MHLQLIQIIVEDGEHLLVSFKQLSWSMDTSWSESFHFHPGSGQAQTPPQYITDLILEFYI